MTDPDVALNGITPSMLEQRPSSSWQLVGVCRRLDVIIAKIANLEARLTAPIRTPTPTGGRPSRPRRGK